MRHIAVSALVSIVLKAPLQHEIYILQLFFSESLQRPVNKIRRAWYNPVYYKRKIIVWAYLSRDRSITVTSRSHYHVTILSLVLVIGSVVVVVVVVVAVVVALVAVIVVDVTL